MNYFVPVFAELDPLDRLDTAVVAVCHVIDDDETVPPHAEVLARLERWYGSLNMPPPRLGALAQALQELAAFSPEDRRKVGRLARASLREAMAAQRGAH